MGHCIGMCGGFVMAYSSAKIDTSASSLRQFFAHLSYNLGRISSYTFLGMIFGVIGSVFTFSSHLNGYFYFAIGILMVLMGLSMMGKIKFLTSLEATIAFNPFIKTLFSKLIHSKTMASFYGLGVLNGFLPCGLVYFFLAAAATSGSLLGGGLIMALFGLATMPAMLGLGFVVGFLKGSGFREVMIKIASLIIMGYGIYMAYLGYTAAIA
ncbi:sulfite exporter TauE/SafE family protein [Sulfurospirillum multivorans]|uniref:DsbD family protein n=1 Tax=Sulfurospirillum multivorans (strain DM 12446 / JCM 15788 / NBRC 109480) TaxID=1150621 RepID=A0AA86ANQ7_SULMK|nr:sulfite exporter TauE/SafE family protein [Sulfurospirillum multivorans]AHJ13899.1 DsbD family protein [Sulfurospirillum multivorans DSM 12446]